MTRWWAPGGPRLAPTSDDLALLEPGSDKKLDLGQYLLAVHRMGAAACEEVAASPIPNDTSLIQTLAKAREQFAGPVVESVSKCLGDKHYSDLMVRDYLDDAEEGALDVFKSCVSKGVPASIAAQRAGMVYGVPKDTLGPFKAVAVELRAHPQVLQDTADRCLFQAVEKAVLEEMAEAVEDIVKATAVLDRPDTKYYDARDTKGRFASNVSVSALVQQKQKAQQKAQEAVQAVQRVSRVQRVQRVERVEQTQAQDQKTQAAQQAKQQAKQQVRQTSKQALQQIAAVAIPSNKTSGGKGGGNDHGGWGDMLRKTGSGGEHFNQMHDGPELRVSMTGADWATFLDAANYDNGSPYTSGPRYFRMGALRDRRHEPLEDGQEYTGIVTQLADDVRAVSAAAKPATVTLDHETMARRHYVGGQAAEDDYIDEVAWDMAHDYVVHTLNKLEGTAETNREIERELYKIKNSPAVFDSMGRRVLIHRTPNSRDAELVEFVIEEGQYGVEVTNQPGVRMETFHFNPDQIYAVDPTNYDLRYDPEAGAMMRRYRIRPASEDEIEDLPVSKATTVLDRPDTKYYDARDTKGRFATSTKLVQALEQRTQSSTKINRVQRVGRVQRVSAQQQTAQPQQQARQQASQKASLKVQQARVAAKQQASMKIPPGGGPGKSGPGFTQIKAGSSYAVMSPEDLASLAGQEGPLDPSQVARLVGGITPGSSGYGSNGVGQLVFGEDVHSNLHDLADEMDPKPGDWELVGHMPFPAMMEQEIYGDADQVHFRVDDDAVARNAQTMRLLAAAFFEMEPDATRARMIKQGDNQPILLQRDQRDFTTSTKPDPIVLVEVDDDFKASKPAVLEVMGETRKSRLIPPNDANNWEEVDAPDFALHSETGPSIGSHPAHVRNPKIRMYKLRNA